MTLITIRPGPTICLWKDGELIFERALTFNEAKRLVSSVILYLGCERGG